LKSECTDLRLYKQSLERRLRAVDQDLEDARAQMREAQGLKVNSARELEVVRRERNFLAESIREL
jgi:F0F1-type ATP synthase membrane subunit b/b'